MKDMKDTADEWADIEERRRKKVEEEVTATVLAAPDGTVSKRELLGIERKRLKAGTTPLFGEEQSNLFSSGEKAMTCERCGKETEVWIVSYFNTDKLCDECVAKERAHPKFAEARHAEELAVRNGVSNFRGIGKPSDL